MLENVFKNIGAKRVCWCALLTEHMNNNFLSCCAPLIYRIVKMNFKKILGKDINL